LHDLGSTSAVVRCFVLNKML